MLCRRLTGDCPTGQDAKKIFGSIKTMNSLDTARNIFLKMFHLSAPLYFLWLDYYMLRTAIIILMAYWDQIGFPIVMKGSQLITIWTQVLQQIYYFIVAWEEVTTPLKIDINVLSTRSANYIKRIYFPTIVFPMSVVVIVNFWTVYTLDPLLLDDLGIMDRYVSSCLNHSLHTNVMVITLLETILNSELVFLEKNWYTATFTIIFVYTLFCIALALICPRCVYPLTKYLGPSGMLLYMFANFLVATAAYKVAKRLHRSIWGKRKETV